MKLKVPEDYQGEIKDADNVRYFAKNGTVEIPDEKLHDGFWGMGFVRIEEPKAK